MKVKIIEQGTVYHSEKPFNYCGWPTVAKLKDQTLAVVFSGHRAWHVCPFGRVLMCKSTDNGDTWSQPQIVIDTLLDDRDGGICVFGENKDKVFVSSFTNLIERQLNDFNIFKTMPQAIDAFIEVRSDAFAELNKSYYKYLFECFDRNEAERKYLGGTYKISYDNCNTFTDFGLLPITAPHGPCVDKDGNLIFIGWAYSDKEKYGNFKRLEKGFWMLKSKDGKNWDEPSLVLPLTDEQAMVYCEAHTVVTNSGRILVHIRGEEEGKKGTFQTYSDDGGKSFTPLKLIAEKGFPAHLSLINSGDILSTYGYRFDDMGIRARISQDNGETWSEEFTLATFKSSDLGYPSTVEITPNNFLTIYYKIEEGNKNAGIYYIKWSI